MKGNLKPYKPGQSGNPNGRPPKIPALDKLLAQTCDEIQLTKVIQALVKKAQQGNVRAIEVLMDRIYGKAKSEITLDSKSGIDWTTLPDDLLHQVLQHFNKQPQNDKDIF